MRRSFRLLTQASSSKKQQAFNPGVKSLLTRDFIAQVADFNNKQQTTTPNYSCENSLQFLSPLMYYSLNLITHSHFSGLTGFIRPE
jgi:hypothetical protein